MQGWLGRKACMLLAALWLWGATAGAVTVLTSGGKNDEGPRLDAAREDIRARKLGSYGMVPIYARDIEDGVYEVGVASTSPFFKIVRAELTVAGDAMRADIEIGSDSYRWVYMGDMAAAQAAAERDWISGEATGTGTVFTIPVPALNAPFECAAYSRARQRWYDRQLLIDAADLPDGALAFALPDYALAQKALLAYEAPGEPTEGGPDKRGEAPRPVAVSMPDGEYSVEVNLAGGSGRASVSSPTLLTVRDGHAWARLLWSSPYYDYMLIGGARYENLTVDGGNSTFEIPVTAMDAPMEVIADTTPWETPSRFSTR